MRIEKKGWFEVAGPASKQRGLSSDNRCGAWPALGLLFWSERTVVRFSPFRLGVEFYHCVCTWVCVCSTRRPEDRLARLVCSYIYMWVISHACSPGLYELPADPSCWPLSGMKFNFSFRLRSLIMICLCIVFMFPVLGVLTLLPSVVVTLVMLTWCHIVLLTRLEEGTPSLNRFRRSPFALCLLTLLQWSPLCWVRHKLLGQIF